MKRAGTWAVAILVVASGAFADETNEPIRLGPGGRELLVPKPARDGGWSAREESGALLLELPARKSGEPFGNATVGLDAAPLRGKRVRLSAEVKVEGGPAQLWLRVDREGQRMGFFDNMGDRPVTAGEWTACAITGSVAADAEQVWLGLIAFRAEGQQGPVRAWLRAARLEVVGEGDPAEAAGRAQTPAASPVGRPGIVLARGAYGLQGFAGQASERHTVRLPMPLAYGAQVPLTWELAVTPPERLVEARLERDALGNSVAVLGLALPVGELVGLEWTSLILVAPETWAALPARVPFPAEWPAEARPWLQSTFCAQSDDPRIREIARRIRGESTDVREVIARALVVAGEVRATTGQVQRLTALDALDAQGSCTSNANLLAALLRASGVPTRILAGYPTWSGPLQTHYTVEAFLPGSGWYPIESTMLQAPWPLSGQVQVRIVPPEHEDTRADLRPSACGGVPYLSLTEVDAPILTEMRVKPPACDHEAQLATPLEGGAEAWTRALEVGRARWEGFLSGFTRERASTELKRPALAEVKTLEGLVLGLEPH